MNADYGLRMARRLIIAEVMRYWKFTDVYSVIMAVRLIEYTRYGRAIRLYK